MRVVPHRKLRTKEFRKVILTGTVMNYRLKTTFGYDYSSIWYQITGEKHLDSPSRIR